MIHWQHYAKVAEARERIGSDGVERLLMAWLRRFIKLTVKTTL